MFSAAISGQEVNLVEGAPLLIVIILEVTSESSTSVCGPKENDHKFKNYNF